MVLQPLKQYGLCDGISFGVFEKPGRGLFVPAEVVAADAQAMTLGKIDDGVRIFPIVAVLPPDGWGPSSSRSPASGY